MPAGYLLALRMYAIRSTVVSRLSVPGLRCGMSRWILSKDPPVFAVPLVAKISAGELGMFHHIAFQLVAMAIGAAAIVLKASDKRSSGIPRAQTNAMLWYRRQLK